MARTWTFRVVPADGRAARVEIRLDGAPLEALVVSTVSRLGVESTRVSVPLDEWKGCEVNV